MANTYYDSQLTAAEIEAVLEAISGILTPANNGKVLAISNGKFEARSVQWGGGEPTIESLSVTENGTYTAPSGVDGYSPVTVNVAGGGGGGAKNILGGTITPTSSQGSDGDIYIKYSVGADVFGTPSSDNPSDGTINATSTYSSYSPYKAFGNQAGWGASGSQGTLVYSFTSDSFVPQKLSFIDYFDVSGGYLKANTFTFEGSNDGNAWDVLYTKSEAATEKDIVKTVSISSNISYSKFRFVVNGGSGYAGIKNVVLIAEGQEKPIDTVYLKVDGAWIILEDGDWNDVNTEGGGGQKRF